MTLKKSLAVLAALALCETALAEFCPKCNFLVMPQDNFCPGCRYDLRQMKSRSKPPPPVYKPGIPVKPSKPLDQRHITTSEYSFFEDTFRLMRKSDLVTPIKFGILDSLALPWDTSCSVYGLHFAAIGGQCHTIYGLSFSGIGCTCHTFGGIGFGFFNRHQETSGLQIGFFNCSAALNGMQLGIVNFADPRQSSGIQLGLINIFTVGFGGGGGWFVPVVNMCF